MEMTLEQAEKEFVLNCKHGKIHIKKYIGRGSNVVVPEFIDGMPVTKIEKMAFFGSDIIGAVIPHTVRYIDISAFSFCKALKKVSFCSRVYIRNDAFLLSGLEEISGIEYIEGNALDVYTFRSTPFFENTEELIIGDKLLWCHSKVDVYIVPSYVKVIGYRAFANSKIRKIILPDELKEIRNLAFYHAEIESIIVPDSVDIVGKKAFGDCNLLKEIQFPKDFCRRNGWNCCLGLNIPVFEDTQLMVDNNDDVLIYKDVRDIICKSTVYRDRYKQREKQIFPECLEYLKNPKLFAYSFVNVFRNDSFKVGDVKEVFDKEFIYRTYCRDGRRRFKLIFDLADSYAEVLMYFPALPFINGKNMHPELTEFYNACITNGSDGRFFDFEMYDGHILEQEIPFRIKAEIACERCSSGYRLSETALSGYKAYFQFHRKKLYRLLQNDGYEKMKEFFDGFLTD